MNPALLLDAQSALNFLVPQLTRIETEVYQTKYPDYNFGALVPVDSSGPEWIKSVTFFSIDWVGAAKWQAGGSDDIPLADVIRSRFEEGIYLGAVGYEYNLEEISTAALVPGMNLNSDKAAAARLAYAQFMYSLALFGNTEKNMTGITNNASVTAGNFAADGTGSSILWTTKTPAQIVRDINSLLTGIYTASKTVEYADTLLLPIDLMTYLGQTPYSSTTMDTILSFVLRTNQYTLETGIALKVRAVRGLEDAGAGGTGRVVAYKNDPSVLKLHLPMPHRFLPVFQNGPLRWLVPGIFRTGGVEIRRPVAVRYGDGAVA